MHENEGQSHKEQIKYKSSIDIHQNLQRKKENTIVLKSEAAEASGKRLHPCFVTCNWDNVNGSPLKRGVPLHEGTTPPPFQPPPPPTSPGLQVCMYVTTDFNTIHREKHGEPK